MELIKRYYSLTIKGIEKQFDTLELAEEYANFTKAKGYFISKILLFKDNKGYVTATKLNIKENKDV